MQLAACSNDRGHKSVYAYVCVCVCVCVCDMIPKHWEYSTIASGLKPSWDGDDACT